MKLELIVPSTQENRRKQKRSIIPPLGLAMVAALTPPDIEVSLTDENVTTIDFSKKPDLVGITALTTTAPRAYEIADTFRAKGAKVVLGGIHPSMLPDEAAEHADAVVIGEAEGIWPELIDDFKANKLQKRYQQEERPSMVDMPSPRRDLFAKGAYLLKNTVSTTRGCPYSCSFCTVTTFFGQSYRCRPVEEVIREVKALGKTRMVIFVDDNIVGSPKYAKELFRALIPLNIKWLSQASVTVAEDDELLELAAASGCVDLFIGFESLSPENLLAVGKKINAADEYENVIKKIRSYGIGIHGFFIFGLDDDKPGCFERAVHFAQDMRLESAQFDILTPYPGTAVYESLDKEGRILTRDWSQYGHDLMFKPKTMSRDSLQKGRAWAWREFYGLRSIWRRIGLKRPNLLIFWAANLYYYYRVHWLKSLH